MRQQTEDDEADGTDWYLSKFDKLVGNLLTDLRYKSPTHGDQFISTAAKNLLRAVARTVDEVGGEKGRFVAPNWEQRSPPIGLGLPWLVDEIDQEVHTLINQSIFPLATKRIATSLFGTLREDSINAMSRYMRLRCGDGPKPPDLGLFRLRKKLVDSMWELAAWDGDVGKVDMRELLRTVYPGLDERIARTRLRSLKRAVMLTAEELGSSLWIDLGKDEAEIKV